ncbi:MAG: hypothetical protein HGA29_02340 [Syntrophaceae bacterium]|nr:hypothetical protein [Syntrophaceae bacterium]
MKTIVAVILVVAVLAAASFFGLPMLIDQQTAPIKKEMKDLNARLQKAESFIQAEEEARKKTQLPPDADVQKIIQMINALSAKLTAMETSTGKKFIAATEEIKGQKAATEAALKKQSEALEKEALQTREKLRNTLYKALLEVIRGNILKAKVDVVAKNIGNAKNELDGVAVLLEKAKNMAAAESRKKIEELQGTLKKAKAELDTDLSMSLNRIELIWHEINGLMKEEPSGKEVNK